MTYLRSKLLGKRLKSSASIFNAFRNSASRHQAQGLTEPAPAPEPRGNIRRGYVISVDDRDTSPPVAVARRVDQH